MVLRDPRDCVELLRSVFVPNSAMCRPPLEGSARLYADTMGLAPGPQPAGLRYTEVRYEDVVSDVATASRALVDQVGEPWHDQVVAYRQQSAHQTVRTPSYSAVSRPCLPAESADGGTTRPPASILPLLDPSSSFGTIHHLSGCWRRPE